MVLRRSPPKADLTLPKGWIATTGKGCPVDPESKPAVMMRGGLRIQINTTPARDWFNFSEGSLWEWSEDEPDSWDIVAYHPETGDDALPQWTHTI